MNLRIIIGVVAISIIILSSVAYIGSIEDKYGEVADMTGFNKTETRLNEMNQNSSRMYDKLYRDSIKSGDVSITFTVLKLGVDGARMMWDSVSIFQAIFIDSWNLLTTTIPLPAWLLASISAVIMGSIIIWFVSLLLRWYAG